MTKICRCNKCRAEVALEDSTTLTISGLPWPVDLCRECYSSLLVFVGMIKTKK